MAGRNETWRTKSALWRRLQPLARGMRVDATEAEKLFWKRARGNQMDGIRFRRQHPLDRFIVDFYVPEGRLAIELDGGIHTRQREPDGERDAYLGAMGIMVIRIRSEEILHAPESALNRVHNAVRERLHARAVRGNDHPLPA